MKYLLSASFLFFANLASADGDSSPLPLAPESTVVACDTQPPDDEKLMKALSFLISNQSSLTPVIEVDGEPTARDAPPLMVENPGAALAAQPDCCWVAYEDNESQWASALRERLDANFGGFAYARIGYRVRSGDMAGKVVYVWQSYTLNTCGYPVFVMSGF